MESSCDAIITKSLDGTILSWNRAAEAIFGYKAEEIVGQSIRVLIPEDSQNEENEILSSIIRGERVPRLETERLHKNGTLVPLEVTVSPVRNAAGEVVAASKVAHDLTGRRKLQRQIEESENRFRLLADNMAQLAWIAGPDGRPFWYNKRWQDFTGTTLETMDAGEWMNVHDPSHREPVANLWMAHVQRGQKWEDTFPLRSKATGEYRWFLSRALPIRDEHNDIVCWFGTNTDVTEMRNAEERIELLMREVNHRAKNMLAIVQSLARYSDVEREGFTERFEQRIQALAANQDLLVNRAWSPVPVEDMVRTQLVFLSDATARCKYTGPPVLLGPSSIEVLSMAIHELAINALKYGSLSNSEGSLTITWRIESIDGQDHFVMEWIETGGPPVAEPARRGFGSRIIVDVPRLKLNADVVQNFTKTGLVWKLSCALASIA